MSTHTPIPWRVDEEHGYIRASDNKTIIAFLQHSELRDADYIVQCVNGYDDLLAALKKIAEHTAHSDYGQARASNVIARAAIAKAKGTQ